MVVTADKDAEFAARVIIEGEHFAHDFIDKVGLELELENQDFSAVSFETAFAFALEHLHISDTFGHCHGVLALGKA